MATEAAWLKGKRTHVSKNKNLLTRTGLLMEGLGPTSSSQIPFVLYILEPIFLDSKVWDCDVPG